MSKERPILFSGPMVRALLDGSKTQTRRECKPQPIADRRFVGGHYIPATKRNPGQELSVWAPYVHIACPYGQPGDSLWVRETFYAWGHWTKRLNKKKGREEWHFADETVGTSKAYRYEVDEKLPRRKRELHEVGWWKRPAIFMPRAASRITLQITRVRVEGLQNISDADCVAEGCGALRSAIGCPMTSPPDETVPRAMFRALWKSINGPESWAADPWVWAINFCRLT
ncbi:hypothetical protein [Acidovorax sp. BL-A-41-H1]|uniref:hypothetical protein n=1 Tax=Acidovorax sp. BL-A-41-H1 TaxID=3421102 RepID=UPI003F7950BB